MKTRMILAAAWLAAAALEAHAQPQAVYRCGNSYSAQPCEGGTTLALDASRPGPDAAAAAEAATRRDARLAAEMQRERQANERAAPRAVIFRSSRMAEPEAAPAPKKKGGAKGGKDDPKDFSALAPAAKSRKN